MIPTIISITKNGKNAVDLLSIDFENRRIWLVGEINDNVAMEIISQIEYLDSIGSDDICMYINSPGGSVSSGLAIVDAMNRAKCDVSTTCTGIAASMAAFILSCGTKGKRYATRFSEMMLHQPLGGVHGQASDIKLAAIHVEKTKKRLYGILAENTGKSIEKIENDCDRDYYLDAEEALDYCLIDKII